MTSDQAQIQALIDGIDEALNKTSPRLPWVMSHDAAQQRQVLEQTRQYLTSLQQQTAADPPLSNIESAPQLPAALEASSQLSAESPSESAQQVLQAVLQEMNYWRVNMLQPLRTEIDSLQRQREMLTQEICQLESRRQQHSLGAQPNQQLLIEFLQSAMAQMQANLSSQVTQMIASQMQTNGQPVSASALTPPDRLAQMQTAQMQSDQLMLKLDSTLQVIFESLNRNVQTYEESLEQGLNRMHTLGQQGEAMFAFLVNRLAQQLGREASTFLQASAPSNWQPSSSLPAESEHETPHGAETDKAKVSDFLSQIPDSSQSTFVPAVPFDLSEEVLDIAELELLEQPEQTLDQPPLENNLAGLDLALSQLDLSAIPAIEPETPSLDLFAGNQPLSVASELPDAQSESFPPASPLASDLDSALDLLNQLSAEMQANLAMAEEAPPQPSAELSSETELITVPDSLYDDAFYSLADATTAQTGAGSEPRTDALPLDAMTLEQSWFDGLGDPAAELQTEPTPQPDLSSSPVNQSLENFLLSNPAPAADPDWFAEFADPFAHQSTSPSAPDSEQADLVEAPVETITSLTDLIPTSEASDLGREAAFDPEPESLEALPIAEAPSQNFEVDLGNLANGLAPLSPDLEPSGSSAPLPELAETNGDLFADLPNADLSTPDPATPAPSEPNSNPPNVTIEGLEDLFADLPSAENSSRIQATPDLFAQLKAAFAQDAGTPLETEQPIVLEYLDSEPSHPSDSTDASDSEKKIVVQITPIANLESFGSEWILDTSWIAPPATNTLAELIRDLTQRSSDAPEVDSSAVGPAEPPLTLSNLFEDDEDDPVENTPAAGFGEAENASQTDSATRFELPQLLDLEPKIPPIQSIEIQPVESDDSSASDLTLADLFAVEPAALSPVAEPEQSQPEPLASMTADVAPVEPLTSELDTAMLDQLAQLLAEPVESPELLAAPPDVATLATEAPNPWFLGIDIGTTGIAAVLLNQTQCQLYPLYWQTVDAAAPSKQFRLATTVTLAAANPSASAVPTIRLEPAPADAVRLHLSDWKPYLKLAVPHYSPQTSQWEPVLQWSDQPVPLRTLQEALQQLLATLHPDRDSFMPTLTCAAVGLEADLPAILRNLAGIVVGYPNNWSDTYSFNVREAILQTELVARPDQIVFIEEPIAALLSALPAADGRSVSLAEQGQSGHLHNANWRGVTLILTAGASLTELVLVNLPQHLEQLNPTDFYVRSLPYAGHGIDQDVLSQLLLPALLNLDPDAPPAETSGDSDFVIEPFDLNELGLANLSLPAAAELDFDKRHRFQQLLSCNAGRQLLTVARTLKIMLQYQPRFTVQFGAQQFTIERQDLTSRVLLPYVQRLNRELNTLLAQTNTTATTVKQVICTGGTGSLSAIARWLQQKLPNATIIQDTYPRPVSFQTNSIPSCSRVAYGLATVPLHPQVIDTSRHRYSDYFLLLELLRTVPPQPVQIETIMQLLEQRGIDTQACRFRILALLDGHLPPGLVPANSDLAVLTLDSAINPDYQAIQFAPVFAKQADRTYQPNPPQRDYLQQYLETLLADTEQTLEQPLAIELGLGAES